MSRGKVTVLFSGGIDSTSCLHLLKSDGYEVTGLFVDFGQASALMEHRSVQKIGELLSIPIEVIRISSEKNFATGELAGRNAFLIFSVVLFGRHKSGLVAIGLHAGTPYYDCTPPFIESIDPLVLECSGGHLSVVAPFLHWSKDEVYSYFKHSGIPLSYTYSCEAGSEEPCGDCASCKDRMRIRC